MLMVRIQWHTGIKIEHRIENMYNSRSDCNEMGMEVSILIGLSYMEIGPYGSVPG